MPATVAALAHAVNEVGELGREGLLGDVDGPHLGK